MEYHKTKKNKQMGKIMSRIFISFFLLMFSSNIIAQETLTLKQCIERAIEKNITEVAFDRSGFNYHGRVKALAESARENGLKF